MKSRVPPRVALVAAGSALCLSATACTSTTKTDTTPSTTLTVFAASSLTKGFEALQTTFQAAHPNVTITFDFDSSTTLAQQVTSGAPADVIATADQTSMTIVSSAHDTAATPKEFATNALLIAVPPGNPGHVTGVASLNTVPFLTCDPSVPCGAAAAQMLQNAGVTATPKSYQDSDADLLTQIETNNVDAGVVYVSDQVAAGKAVDSITIPASVNVTNPYYIAAVKGSKNATAAQEWVDYVLSSGGQQILRQWGFGSP